MPGLQPKVFSLTWHKMQWGHQNFRSSLYDSNLKNLRNTVLYQGFSASQTFSSVAQLYLALCNPVDCSMPGFLVLHQLPELAQTHVHRVSDANQPSCPFLLLPSILPSIRVFSSELAIHIRWPKCWSFSIRPSNEYLGLISFGKDWFDLLDTTLISIDTTLSKMLPSWLKDCPLLAQAGLLKYRCPPGENLH